MDDIMYLLAGVGGIWIVMAIGCVMGRVLGAIARHQARPAGRDGTRGLAEADRAPTGLPDAMDRVLDGMPGYTPMSAAEIADMEGELGRELTEGEAMEIMRRERIRLAAMHYYSKHRDPGGVN